MNSKLHLRSEPSRAFCVLTEYNKDAYTVNCKRFLIGDWSVST